MSVSGNTATSSNSSESYCSSPPLPPVPAPTQQQHSYYPQYNSQQYPHQGYYQDTSQQFYQNPQPGWTGNTTPAQHSGNPILPQSQHYYPYQYTHNTQTQQYPQQLQLQHPHALVDLSRFVQQQSPTTSSAPLPSLQPHKGNINTSEMQVNPSRGSPDPGSTSPASMNVNTSATPMMPVRFQNMKKGARTKASMRKLKQEQSSPSKDAVNSVKIPKRASKNKKSEGAEINGMGRTSVDEAIEATVLFESFPDDLDVQETSTTSNRSKRKSKTPETKTNSRKKKLNTPGVEMDIANTLLDLKKSPAKSQNPSIGEKRRKSAENLSKVQINKSSLGITNSSDPVDGCKGKEGIKTALTKRSDDNSDPVDGSSEKELLSPRRRGRPPSGMVSPEAKGSKPPRQARRRKTQGVCAQSSQVLVDMEDMDIIELIDLESGPPRVATDNINMTIPRPVKPVLNLPVIPQKMKPPIVRAKKSKLSKTELPPSTHENKEKLRSPSIKVLGGAVKFYRGSDEEDPNEPLGKLNVKDRVLGECANNEPWECIFCGIGSLEMKLGDLFGPYYFDDVNQGARKKEAWVHQDCAVWAGGVLLVGSTLRGLDDAVCQADKMKCTICKNKGATIACLSKGCTSCVHFPCGKLNEWSLDYHTFHSYCQQHKGV